MWATLWSACEQSCLVFRLPAADAFRVATGEFGEGYTSGEGHVGEVVDLQLATERTGEGFESPGGLIAGEGDHAAELRREVVGLTVEVAWVLGEKHHGGTFRSTAADEQGKGVVFLFEQDGTRFVDEQEVTQGAVATGQWRFGLGERPRTHGIKQKQDGEAL